MWLAEKCVEGRARGTLVHRDVHTDESYNSSLNPSQICSQTVARIPSRIKSTRITSLVPANAVLGPVGQLHMARSSNILSHFFRRPFVLARGRTGDFTTGGGGGVGWGICARMTPWFRTSRAADIPALEITVILHPLIRNE